MAISQNFPDEGPSLVLNFAGSRRLDPRVTFTRTSTGTYMDRNGLIVTAGINQPRFDHTAVGIGSTVTGVESLGLLIEESRTNFITSSNNFGGDTIYYGIIAGATTSPDGTTNGVLMYETAINDYHFLTLNTTFVVSTTYCASIFCKYAGSKYRFRLKFGDGLGVNNNIIIDLRNGSIISGSGVSNSYGVIPYPNGWYRVYTTLTATSTSGFFQPFLLNDSDGSSIYQGDGSSGFFIYGAQVEAGAFPTSYIPTSGSQVTRSADNASIIGTNFSSWYNQSEGTVFVQAAPSTNAAYSGYIYGIGSDFNNMISAYRQVDYQPVVRIRTSTSDLYGALGYGANWTVANSRKIILTFKTNSFNSAVNATVSSDVTTGTLPPFNGLTIGNFPSGSNPINGTISQFAYYPKRLTNSQLQTLTR